MRRLRYLLTSFLICASFGEVCADRGVRRDAAGCPVFSAVYASTPPVVDAVLDDPVWTYATQFDDFHCTQLDRAPSESTVVWLAYDDSYLYFAARCYDRHTDQLRMEQTHRSGSLFTDDYIAFELDVEHQHRSNGAYAFRVNPRGTQDERIPDGSASKVEWRGDWTATARIDSLGWTAEFAVPLVLFNRPAGTHTIGVSVHRSLRSTNELIDWPNMGANWDRTKTGNWTGITMPKQKRIPVFMPYVVAGQTRTADYDDDGEDDGPVRTRREAYVSVDMKYTTPHGLAVVGTIYPDFKNVESDVLGLDFSYGERYRQDNRPFFAEGRRYLPDSWVFYSNRVEEMYGGGKVFGQLGNHRVGLIGAYDRENVTHTAGKWYWQPFTRFEVQNSFAWRHGPKDAPRRDEETIPLAPDNLVAVGVVSKSRLVGNSTEYFSVQGGFTRTASDTGNGYDLEAGFDRFGGNGSLSVFAHVRLISPGFMPIDGLFDVEDADQRSGSLRFEYGLERDRRFLRQWKIGTGGYYADRFGGALYRRGVDAWGWVEMMTGGGIWGEVEDQKRPPYHDRIVSAGLWWNDHTLYTGGRFGIRYGRRGGTDYVRLEVGQGIRAWGPTTLSVRGQYQRRDFLPDHDEPPEHLPEGGLEEQYQTIVTAQYDITPEHSVSGRVIYKDNGSGNPIGNRFNGYVTYRQVVRRGLDFFLIVGDPSAESWTKRVALKAMIVL